MLIFYKFIHYILEVSDFLDFYINFGGAYS